MDAPGSAVKGMRFPGHGMGWKEFLTALKREWTNDRVSDVAGMVTFQGILALFPFVLFLVALAGVLIDPAQEQELIRQFARIAPAAVTQILAERVRSLTQNSSTGLLTASALVAIWSASGGVLALMRALNTTYGVEESRRWWKTRAIALGTVFVGAVLTIVAVALAVAALPIANALPGPVGTALMWLRLPVAGLLMMFLWACLYYFLPDVEQRFRFITPGSVVGVVLWVIASWGFSVYVANFGRYDVTYGALGGVVVMLVWMWISAMVILLGAEINAVVEHRSPEGKEPGARRVGEHSDGKKTTPVGEAEPRIIVEHVPARPSLFDLRDRRTRLFAAGAALAALFSIARRRTA